MKILTLILFILTFIFSATAQDAQAIFNRGFEHYQNKRYDDAIKDFTEVIRLNPTVSNAYGMRGVCYYSKRTLENPPARTIKIEGLPIVYKSQNSVNAVADLNKAIQINPPLSATSQPNVFEQYKFRFWANVTDYDYRPAIADLKALVNANPDYAINFAGGTSIPVKTLLFSTQNEYAEYLISQTKGFNQAIVFAEKLLAVRFDAIENAKMEQDKANVKKLYLEAIENYQPDVTLISTKRADIYSKRGYANTYVENWQAAIADFKESLKLKPNEDRIMEALASSYKGNKQFDLAITEYDKIIASVTSTDFAKLGAKRERAIALSNVGKADEALNYFNESISKYPNDHILYLDRGRVYLKKGNKQLAKADFNKAIELAKPLEYGHYTVKDAQKELDILDGKIKPEIEKKPKPSVQPKPNPTPQIVKPPTTTTVTATNPPLKTAIEYFSRGRQFYDLGRADEAIADFTEAIKLKPNDFDAYFYRADTLWRKKGEFEKAVADYTEAIRINPDFTNAYYWRGVVYKELQKYDLAKIDFQTVLKRMPTHSLAKQQLESLPK
jgi:tetratricopeptide (TPR) repeat protein